MGSGAGGAQFRRGQPVNTKQLADKKLRGRLEHTEALAEEAASSAAAAHQWLMPSFGGSLEAEGMERTWRFSQTAIVQGGHCREQPMRVQQCAIERHSRARDPPCMREPRAPGCGCGGNSSSLSTGASLLVEGQAG